MIRIKKLRSLKDGTRERKIVRILRDWETGLERDERPDPAYFIDFLDLLREEEALKEYRARREIPDSLPREGRALRFLLNSLRHELLNFLGTPPAEWDLLHPEDGGDSAKSRKFPCRLYLDEIRSPFNLGSIFRTAECLGVSEIFLSPGTADPDHPRARRSAMGCIEHIPWRRMSYEELGLRTEKIFAMELGGDSIGVFDFPDEGILIIGSEEVGVSPEALSLAGASGGIVSIDLYGAKASLNVGVAFGIVMQTWSERFARLKTDG
jgi:TrmH family RNA methyltransferase